TTKNLIPLSICMIDIDKFKSLNDQLGHLRGDHCLRVVADTIRNNLRGKSDILIRYGGDEFLLILPGTDGVRAVEVAERVLAAITDLQHANPGSPFGIITASIGVYTHLSHPISGDTLIEHADTALYRAKTAGRNRVSA
ncbi:MAG: GGDEF domain-containing protein, partial [Acidocella sp.]|nr:GGDEF domain-containing protein [Acidocella sp.]